MATVQQVDKSKSRGKCRSWRLWVNSDGRRRSRRFHGTYTDALAAASAFEAELAGDAAKDATGFMEYGAIWQARREESGEFAPGTLENGRRALRAFRRTALADKALAEVTTEDCREALLWLRGHPVRGDKPLSGTTLNKLHRALYSILEEAEVDGRIMSNPMRRLKAPKIDTKEKRALPPDRLAQVAEEVRALPLDGRTVAVSLMLLLGLRRGEACGVLASDLDMAAGVLHVRHAVKERDGSVGAPKSAAGVRTLPLPPAACEVLSDWITERQRRGLADARTLCCNSYGRVMRPQLLQRWWCEVRESVGCEGLTLHELRHSNLSMMARFMPSAFDLQRWAGWSSLEPARVYIHSDLDALTAGVTAAFGDSAHQKRTRNE